MDISVVIPLYNEEESLPELYDWIERVMSANNFSFEVIFVNDGSTDHSWDVITELAARSELLAKALGGKDEEILAAMAELRKTVDALEKIVPDELWPLPKYREMLFVY